MTVNQQIIGKVEGAVAQRIDGTIGMTAEAKRLLSLIDSHAGDSAGQLRTAVFEAEDKNAPLRRRREAIDTLKKFLRQIGEASREVGIDLLQKYMESKLGL